MRAPQYRRVTGPNVMPVGPNPAASRGLCVQPFGKIYALVEGLGVISTHREEADAKTALEAELERRERFNASMLVKDDDAVEAPGDETGGRDD